MRDRLIGAVSILLALWAFHLAADRAPVPFHKRFLPEWVVVSDDWSPSAVRHGRADAVENRVARPRFMIPFSLSDSYLVRVFYFLEGDEPAAVFFSGKRVGRLKAGGRWNREVFSTPFVPAKEKREIAFELPEGSRLSIRRVDHRNYLLNIDSIFLVKPEGGSREPYSAAWLFLVLAALIAIGASAIVLRRGGKGGAGSSGRTFLPVGVLGILIVSFQFFSGYSIHAQPAFLSVIFGAVAAGAALAGARWRWRILLERLALVCVAIIFALVIVEVALRVWDPPISRGRVRSYARFSPEFGWLNRPGVKGWHVDIGYHIRINRHGHRGPDYPVEKPPGVFRILGLGDSLTFGWGVEEDQIFLNVMKERLLEEGYRVEVLNAAVPAWHSVQSLHYFQKEGVRFQPDLVVMSFFVDDVYYAKIESFLKGEIAQRTREEEAEIARHKGGTASMLRLYNIWFNYRRLRRASRELIRRNPYPDFKSERKALRRDFDKDPELVAGVEKVVSEWAEIREKLGVPIIFSFIPAGGSLNAPAYQGDSRALRKASLASGFPFLDVIPLFEKEPDPRKLYLLPRDGHVSAAGHAVIGEALAQMVLKGGWLKK